MLNYLWGFMIIVGVVYGVLSGNITQVADGAIDSSKEAVTLCITMLGVMSLWTGLMQIASKSGLIGKCEKLIAPVMKWLFPDVPIAHKAMEYMTTNVIANIFGLGWAATPAGIKAMEELSKLNDMKKEALFINVFLLDNNRKRNIILVIAAFTTLSTTSIAITICVFFLDFYRKYLRKKKLIIIVPIVAAVVAVIIGIIFYDKLFNNNMSGEVRIDDIIACFKSWEQSPWVGNGFKNIKALKDFRVDWRQTDTAGLSTGIGGVFSDGGLILGSLYTIPFIISLIRLLKKGNKDLLYFVILLFFLFFIMIYHYTALGMFWIAISWYIVVNFKNLKFKEE